MTGKSTSCPSNADMKIRSICCSALLLACTSPWTLANDEAPTLIAPVFRRVDEGMTWTIESRKKGSDSRSTSVPVTQSPFNSEKPYKTKSVAKSNGLLHSKAIGWNDHVTEDWTIDSVTMRKETQKPKISVLDSRSMKYAPRFDTSDFSELQWISPELFVRNETKNGQKCSLYEWTETMPSPKELPKVRTQGQMAEVFAAFECAPVRPTKVWVSSATQLPVAVEDSVARYSYVFGPKLQAPLALPNEFQAAIDAFQKSAQKDSVNQMPKQE